MIPAEPQERTRAPEDLTLSDGSRVAVIGSGPAGSLFTYFLLEMASRIGLDIDVDVYEPRDFARPGPVGCNMCGGIVSESLVQNLAAEGINLPPGVVQRSIDSYVLHMDVGSVEIQTPLHEMRIGAVHRGPGPKDVTESKWESFDHHLQQLALNKGARLVQARVEGVRLGDDGHTIRTRTGNEERYDLIAVAVGVNSATLKVFEDLGIGYRRPTVTKTLIREYHLGDEIISRTLGSAMHVFLLNIPRLEFAALIPKGDYVTMCLLGENIDNELLERFLGAPEVKACMPGDWQPDERSCQCLPHISVRGVEKPFADRVVFVGDCGVTRLYKDGIGAAYRTAKAAARTAVFEGISEAAFRRHYMPSCRGIVQDNSVGKIAFAFVGQAQHLKVLRRALLRMTRLEQARPGVERRLSGVLWDMFTGSAPYKDIFQRMMHPGFVARFGWALGRSLVSNGPAPERTTP